MRVALITDVSTRIDWTAPEVPGVEFATFAPTNGEATLEALAGFDVLVIFAALDDLDEAIELSHVLDHLLHRGKTVAFLYRGRLANHLEVIYERVGAGDYGHSTTGCRVTASTPAWTDFFRSYGQAYSLFRSAAEDETLGTVKHIGKTVPAAVRVRVAQGTVYAVPWHTASLETSHSAVIGGFVGALQLEETGPSELPAFLESLRLPGEQEVGERIERLEEELAIQRKEASMLASFRHLLAAASGDALEQLVIRTFERILVGTTCRVEDPKESFEEDFWLLDEAGDQVALAEVKAMSGHVGRQDINKVDDHREARGFDTADLPGLLVANVFRGDQDLERRVGQPVPPNILAALKRQNVLLLRTSDLYHLLARVMGGKADPEVLLDALLRGGGWLEVTPEAAHFHG